MEEKRTHERFQLIRCLPVVDNDEKSITGDLIDITPEGMLVVSDHPFDAGSTYHFTIRSEEDISCSVMSMWCERMKTTDLCSTGFQILDRTPETDAQVRRLIRAYAFVD